MRPIITILSVFAIILMNSCNKSSDHNFKRIVFDPEGLQVVTSSVNKKLETMSILYGNAEAYSAALSAESTHAAGEKYTFVTWKYDENPLWYGTTINGELLCVERVQVFSLDDGKLKIDYQIKLGKPLPVNGEILNQQDRIDYILEHKPSVMP